MSTGLENLNDIIVPEPITFWPPAEGWLVLLLIGVSFFIPWLYQTWRRYQANRYRREALREAERINNLEDPKEKLILLLDLLKRTAITIYPREQVASLSGGAWLDFLTSASLRSRTAAQPDSHELPPEIIQQLNDVLYNPAASVSQDNLRKLSDQLFNRVKNWIKQHQRIEQTHV